MTTPSSHLVVPVDVQALCVGEHDVLGDQTDPYGTAKFTRLPPDFAALPYLDNGVPQNSGPNLSANAVPEPFDPVGEAGALGQGIHLHWALPMALLQGQGDPAGTGDVHFPDVPNRWLVVRILAENANPTDPTATLSGWIVASDSAWVVNDGLAQNDASVTAPTAPTPNETSNRAYTKVGQVFDLATYTEDSSAAFVARTNALGFGDTSYAAAYPMCTNVFGFHDTLADLPAGFDPATSTVSYLVAGWYSDADNDPIAHLATSAAMTPKKFVADLESDFSWTVDLGAGPVPEALVCSGTIGDIGWDPAHRYVTTPPNNSLTASIGNNRIEAVAAMLAAQPSLSALPNIELLLQAVQAGLLPDFTSSLVTVDEQLHQRQFGSSRAGTVWRVERDRPVPSGPHPAPAPTEPPTLPPGLAEALNALNLAQTAVDDAAADIRSRRQQIFADWTKYMQVEYPPDGQTRPNEPSPNDVQPLIAAEVTALDDQQHQLGTTLNAALTAATTAVDNLLADGLVLKSAEAPRYWAPTDPVVLVAGDEATPPVRHGDTDADLVCRTTATLTSSVSISSGQQTPFVVPATGMPSLTLTAGPTATLAALIADAMLTLPATAPIVAKELASQGSTDNPAVEDFAGFVGSLHDADDTWLRGATPSGTITFSGVAPSPVGHQRWESNPWIPLILQWSAGLVPQVDVADSASADYSPDLICAKYQLDAEAIDLDPLDAPPVPPSAQTFSGSIGLAGRTMVNLGHQINVFLDSHPTDSIDPELREALTGLSMADAPMLAQALSGLREAFRMRHQILQLPVNDPLAIQNGQQFAKFSNVTVHDAVGQENATAALPLGFYNPLNAGYLDVREIQLVDAFGQARRVDVEGGMIRSHAMRPATDPPGQTPALLRPRLSQPSRLRFRWMAAESDQIEMNADPASSPICGWVLFNHLDSSLMIYDAAGTALGSFDLRGSFWQGAPGNDATYDVCIEKVFESANPHLRNFALGVNSSPDRHPFLLDLLRAIDTSTTLIEPSNSKQHRATSVLFGRPLALVRAELDLELQGRPSIDESWGALIDTIDSWDGIRYPDQRPDAGFPDIQVPVRLGDISNLDDGLVGYFIEDGSEDAFHSFYTAAASNASHGVVRPTFEQITVTARAGCAPVIVSMLVDPRASVHATTGLLPVKSIDIPPSMYSDALQNMSVVFLATPVMTSAHEVNIPVPTEAGFSWSWVTRDTTGGGWTVAPKVVSPNPNAPFSYPPQTLVEGWLRLTPVPPEGSTHD